MTIIDDILRIAARRPGRPIASRPRDSGCAADYDPSPLIESLAVPRPWVAGAELADAYRGGCAGPG